MRKVLKRLLSMTLAATCMVNVVGCSNGSKGKSSMGRYVEEVYSAPEGVEVQNLTLLDNEKIGMLDVQWRIGVQ